MWLPGTHAHAARSNIDSHTPLLAAMTSSTSCWVSPPLAACMQRPRGPGPGEVRLANQGWPTAGASGGCAAAVPACGGAERT